MCGRVDSVLSSIVSGRGDDGDNDDSGGDDDNDGFPQ